MKLRNLFVVGVAAVGLVGLAACSSSGSSSSQLSGTYVGTEQSGDTLQNIKFSGNSFTETEGSTTYNNLKGTAKGTYTISGTNIDFTVTSTSGIGSQEFATKKVSATISKDSKDITMPNDGIVFTKQ